MRWLPGIAAWLSGSGAARLQQEGTGQGDQFGDVEYALDKADWQQGQAGAFGSPQA